MLLKKTTNPSKNVVEGTTLTSTLSISSNINILMDTKFCENLQCFSKLYIKKKLHLISNKMYTISYHPNHV